MLKKLLAKTRGLCFLLFAIMCLSCSTIKYYQVETIWQGKGAQGMAIWRNSAFILNVTGLCRIYDLEEEEFVGSYKLASYSDKNHANNASFGVEYFSGNQQYPVMYVSECEYPGRCFVENVTMKDAELLQIIQYKVANVPQVVHNWIVDRENKKLFAVTQKYPFQEDNNGYENEIIRFRLPSTDEGDIIFSEKDIEERFVISFPHILQGGTIYNGILYLPVGGSSQTKIKGKERAVLFIDLKKKEIVNKIDIGLYIKDEPEGVDIWNGSLLFSTSPQGLYKLNLKDV